MNHFHYVGGRLHAEAVPLERIAAEIGTPVYVYSSATLERHYTVFAEALAGLDATIHYALKANANLAVIRTLAKLGAGADVVSEGEMRLALAAGIPARRIVFSGVGKTRQELQAALVEGIGQINIEADGELDELDGVAREFGVKAPVAVRVNPNVDADTHHKITTGLAENKFGIDIDRAPEVCRRAAAMPGIAFRGLAMHIGSQITDLGPFGRAFARLRELVLALRVEGLPVETLDLGGGLGVPYRFDQPEPPLPAAYGALAREHLADLGCHLAFEPGRVLVANAGVLLSRVIRVKQGVARTFLILDSGMNDLVRPAMYDAHHDILPVIAAAEGAVRAPMDVVGPVCETGDTFAKGRHLPPLAAGDLVVFATAGAYGAVMASTYNARPLVPEVLVRGDAYALVRRRPTQAESMSLEMLPEWLGS